MNRKFSWFQSEEPGYFGSLARRYRERQNMEGWQLYNDFKILFLGGVFLTVSVVVFVGRVDLE